MIDLLCPHCGESLELGIIPYTGSNLSDLHAIYCKKCGTFIHLMSNNNPNFSAIIKHVDDSSFNVVESVVKALRKP